MNPQWATEDTCPQLKPSPSSHRSLLWLGADPSLSTPRRTPVQVLWLWRDFGDQHRSFKPPTLKPSLPLCFFAKNTWQDFSCTLLQMLFTELGLYNGASHSSSKQLKPFKCLCLSPERSAAGVRRQEMTSGSTWPGWTYQCSSKQGELGRGRLVCSLPSSTRRRSRRLRKEFPGHGGGRALSY